MFVLHDLHHIITNSVLEKFCEVMTGGNQKLILQYYKTNIKSHPEKFAYHLLLLFYPFAKEEHLLSTCRTYSRKLLDPKVCATGNENKYLNQIVN